MLGEEEKERLLNEVANRIVKMRLSDVAIFLLESSKPISFLSSQFLIFLRPFISVYFSPQTYDKLIEILNDRNNIEKLIKLIEEKEGR
ncbi:MAG: hypothetical protein N2504_05740 [candidate division WOR-3 bacterium]|nr:hypothetical protein [candidate division WOR-3 bacterium]MCX7948072.1 hypothetical protein [candidate division WOR-3 bacterium]MDW8150990.1 hypothetical protein [candidate division WOR-3 bacterium]